MLFRPTQGSIQLNTVLQIEDATKHYRMGEVTVKALRGVSFDVHQGELISILGPSGSGKSTLLNLAGALDRPTSGKVVLSGVNLNELDDNELAGMRKSVGFVFQFYNLIPRLNAKGNVELPLTIAGMSKEERKARVTDALTKVGLGKRMDHKPAELSGGERQRVAIARALVNNPTFLLMDEPTGNLDSETAQDIMELVIGLNEEQHITCIIVTHDPEVSKETPRILRMRDGHIVSDGGN
ncbi:MAG: ABC transporter ATP-binding protein [Candidatus Thorarchaeota archaeon]|nr:ABC transporter ATP-binding protein [Candidatus Thorarchaeota archaeon]